MKEALTCFTDDKKEVGPADISFKKKNVLARGVPTSSRSGPEPRQEIYASRRIDRFAYFFRG